MARWADDRGMGRGAIVPITTVWELAKAWYEGREREEWRPRTPDETTAVFSEVGLTGEFWAGP